MPIDRLYKTLITIPAAQIGSGGVSGFSAKLTTPCFAACPELVTLGSPYALQAGAGDLLIYDSTGTLRYAVDVIRFTLSATWTDSVVEISFGQLSLSSLVDGTFWLYSGHASPQSQPAANAPYGQYAVYESAKVGYWPLSDGSGLTATDRTSNGNNGTLVNGPTWTGAGKVGTALSFDGTDDYVDAGNIGDFSTSAVTLSAWVNVGSFSATYGRPIIAKSTGCNVSEFSLEAGRTANRVGMLWDNFIVLTSNTNLSSNQWYHIAGVRSGTSGNWSAQIFVDGSSHGSTTTTGNPDGNARVGIGKSLGCPPVDTFSGLIDDVRIYNRALVQADVTTVYNSTNSPASFCVLGARQSNVTGSPAAYRRRAASRYGISL